MRQVRQGVRSTKMNKLAGKLEETLTKLELQEKQRNIFVRIEEMKETIYSDQTGKFPVTSSRGNRYIMTLVEIDGK